MFPKLRTTVVVLFTFLVSMTAFAGTNPFLATADNTVVCAADGNTLATFELCGIGGSRNFQVNDPDVQTVEWQVLDTNSCGPAMQGCPNLNGACNWNTVATSSSFTLGLAGEYRVVLTQSNGISELFYANASQKTYSDVVSVTQAVSGNGGTDGILEISVSGDSAPYIYQLYRNGTLMTPFQSSSVFTGLSVGLYQVRTRDGSGVCEYDSSIIELTEPEVLVGQLMLTQVPSCMQGGTIVANATGGVAPYQFALNGGPYTTSNVFTDLTPGGYGVQVVDANGVMVTTNGISITNPQPITAIFTHQDVSCFGEQDGRIEVQAFGGTSNYQYQLSVNGNPFPTQASNVFPNLAPGVYDVVVEDSGGCVSGPQSVVIVEPLALGVTVSVVDATGNGAQDGSITITTSGGTGLSQYAISPNLNEFYTTNEFTGLAAGSYTVLIQDQNGCTFTVQADVAEPAIVTTTAMVVQNAGCSGNGAIEIMATGGVPPYEYSIDSGVTYMPSSISPFIFEGLDPGTYNVHVRDSNGYTGASSVTINETAQLTLDIIIVKEITCNGAQDGRIVVDAQGGDGVYSFQLSDAFGNVLRNFQASGTFENLLEGDYVINVIDSSGCSLTSFVYGIREAAVFLVDGISSQNGIYNVNGGSISFQIQGGAAPYSYSINSAAFVSFDDQQYTITDLASGDYTIILRDVFGCELTFTQTIVPSDAISFQALSNNIKGLRAGDLTCTDFDSDGDLDILTFGDDISANAHALFYENEQLTFNETELNGFPSLYDGAMNWADYNNNGVMNLAVIGYSVDDFDVISDVFEYNGDFSRTNIDLHGVSRGAIEWADYDNDGRKDILIVGQDSQSQSVTKLFQNRDSLFVEVNIDNVTGVSFGDAAWADYNSDGLYDFMITGVTGVAPNTGPPITQLYKNTGNGFQLDENSSFVGVQGSSVDWADADNDGDLDVLITGHNSSFGPFTGLYINEGGSFTLLETALPDVAEGFAKWGDYDNDGDLDVLITGNTFGSIDKVCMVFANDALEFNRVFEGVGVSQASGSWADFNSDGFLDIIVNGQQNDLSLSATIYMNSGTHNSIDDKSSTSFYSDNSGPSIPVNLNAEINNKNATLTWDASTDDKTDSKSLHYAVRLFKGGKVYIPSLSNDVGALMLVEPGNAGLNNFYLTGLLESGDYEWSVQTIDNSYHTSGFSVSQTFTIGDSIEEEVEEKDEDISTVLIYQNPGHTEVVDVIWDVLKASETTIAVYNGKGTLVFTSEIEEGTAQTQIDVANLSRGIYFVYIKNAEMEEVKKVLIL